MAQECYTDYMKKKKIIILSLIPILLVGLSTGYFLWASGRADYYADVSRETNDKQAKILALEKSVELYPKPDNIITLADLYVSIGRDDLAEKIMVGRGEVQILNKLGNLYLDENKAQEAEDVFTKAKNKNLNPDSLKGLVLSQLQKGDRGEAENYLSQLSALDSDSSNCYAAFVYLNNFKKAENAFGKVKGCNIFGIDKYFAKRKDTQSPLYVKLEAANFYYEHNYLQLALSDTLALEREKDNYRDAYILSSKIYEKMGDQSKASEQGKKAAEIDPALNLMN